MRLLSREWFYDPRGRQSYGRSSTLGPEHYRRYRTEDAYDTKPRIARRKARVRHEPRSFPLRLNDHTRSER